VFSSENNATRRHKATPMKLFPVAKTFGELNCADAHEPDARVLKLHSTFVPCEKSWELEVSAVDFVLRPTKANPQNLKFTLVLAVDKSRAQLQNAPARIPL
jgi:hypothetical protein